MDFPAVRHAVAVGVCIEWVRSGGHFRPVIESIAIGIGDEWIGPVDFVFNEVENSIVVIVSVSQGDSKCFKPVGQTIVVCVNELIRADVGL